VEGSTSGPDGGLLLAVSLPIDWQERRQTSAGEAREVRSELLCPHALRVRLVRCPHDYTPPVPCAQHPEALHAWAEAAPPTESIQLHPLQPAVVNRANQPLLGSGDGGSRRHQRSARPDSSSPHHRGHSPMTKTIARSGQNKQGASSLSGCGEVSWLRCSIAPQRGCWGLWRWFLSSCWVSVWRTVIATRSSSEQFLFSKYRVPPAWVASSVVRPASALQGHFQTEALRSAGAPADLARGGSQ